MGKSYRDLIAWQRAMDLVTQVYRISATFPREEIYGLTSQLRRAIVSVPSNIAEGQGRHGAAEFRHFLRQANGSLMEAETQILIAERLGYISSDEVARLLTTAADRQNIKRPDSLAELLTETDNWHLATGNRGFLWQFVGTN